MIERWLIIGGGNMGLRHAEHIRFLFPEAQIVILSSSMEEKSPFIVVRTLEDALKYKPVSAIISNAAPLHCQFAINLLNEGIHILIEKPLSDKYESAEELLEYSKRFPNTIVLVGYQIRYKPGLQFIKENLKTGLLGRIVYAKASIGHFLPWWRPRSYINSVSAQRSLGGGALLELSHEFDYIKNIFGMPDFLCCLSGKISNLEMDVEDTASTSFYYPSKLMVSISQNMVDQLPHRSLEIKGEKGTLIWDLRKDTVQSFNHLQQELHKTYQSGIESSRDLYLKEIQHFVNCIFGLEKPLVSLKDACDTMKLIDLAKKSSENNQKVNVRL